MKQTTNTCIYLFIKTFRYFSWPSIQYTSIIHEQWYPIFLESKTHSLIYSILEHLLNICSQFTGSLSHSSCILEHLLTIYLTIFYICPQITGNISSAHNLSSHIYIYRTYSSTIIIPHLQEHILWTQFTGTPNSSSLYISHECCEHSFHECIHIWMQRATIMITAFSCDHNNPDLFDHSSFQLLWS